MTQLGLERFLIDINMPEDIAVNLRPSIHMTDSLNGWSGIVGHDSSSIMANPINEIKNGQINLIIGNPPWRGKSLNFPHKMLNVSMNFLMSGKLVPLKNNIQGESAKDAGI